MTEAFMVQGSYGKFGLTAAMLRRCKEFNQNGIKSISLTLDFTDNIYSIVDDFKKSGKIDESTLTLNPYIDLSDKACEWQKNLNKFQIENFIFTKAENDNVQYYYTNGRLYDGKYKDYKNIKFVDQKYYKDVLISEVCIQNGKKIKEIYYSKNGLCIAIREWNEDEIQKSILIFDYCLGIIHQYKSSYWWNVEWIKAKVFASFLFNKKKPLLICDGPGTARKITEVSKDIALRLYVLHHNHRANDGKVTQRDYWNLKNSKKFDYIVVLTEEQAKDVRDDFSDIENLRVISNFTNIKNMNFELKNEYLEKNRLGFFGQLIDLKGVKDAIQIVYILNEKYNIPVYLDLYGISPKNNNVAVSKYTDFAASLDVADKVNFKGYSNNVLMEMSTCLCILFPSNSEAQGLSILESMSVGTPVVAYDCKYGPSSMIRNGYNGFICPVGDVEGLAKNVFEIYSTNIRSKLADEAKITAKKLSSTDTILKKWLSLL